MSPTTETKSPKSIDIGYGTPLANSFSPFLDDKAFQKVRTAEEALSLYETYLYRMLTRGDKAVVAAMEEIADLILSGQGWIANYNTGDFVGHHEVIDRVVRLALEQTN